MSGTTEKAGSRRTSLPIAPTLGTCALCWAFSAPGFDVLGMLATAVIWVPALGRFVVGAGRLVGRRSRWPRPMVVSGVVLLAGLAAVWTDTPLAVRWSVSRPTFDRLVPALPRVDVPDGERDPVEHATGWRGAFLITGAYRVPGGYVFYEANGNFIDDAGFAYLPGGPTPAVENGSFESPRFRHLGGPWWAWTASW